MTDHGHDPEHETMTDHTDDIDPSDIPDPIEPDTFEKSITHKFGQRGENVWNETEEQTDLDGMGKKKTVTLRAFCNCGTSITDPDELYRCCSCDEFACENCRFELSRRTYCPDCIREAYGVRRKVFFTLYLLHKGLLDREDLVHAQAPEPDMLDIEINDAATTLVENGFIRLDDTDDAAAISDDDPLSADGKQALHIGEKLYDGNPDVEEFKEQVAIQAAAERGR